MKLNIIVLLALIVITYGIFKEASATDPHHTHEAGADGVDGQDGQDGADGVNGLDGISYKLDDDTIDSIMATSMAISAIEFSHGTRKTQVGVGVGHYSGKNSVSLGLAKLIETEEGEFLAVGKVGWIEDDDEVAVGVGATFLIGD